MVQFLIDIDSYMTYNVSYIIHICCIADDTFKKRERKFDVDRGVKIERKKGYS